MKVNGPAGEKGSSYIKSMPVLKNDGSEFCIWYVIANNCNALVFQKNEEHLDTVADLTPTDEFNVSGSDATRGHINSVDGRMVFSSNPMDREDDHDERMFLKNVIEWLEKAYQENSFDKLVFVAANKTLGAFHEYVDRSPLRKALISEINKDLVNTPLNELESYVLCERLN